MMRITHRRFDGNISEWEQKALPFIGGEAMLSQVAPFPLSRQRIRVFVSSTFRDMHAKRDQLNSVIFLAHACKKEPDHAKR